jgi:hypothetical protein
MSFYTRLNQSAEAAAAILDPIYFFASKETREMAVHLTTPLPISIEVGRKEDEKNWKASQFSLSDKGASHPFVRHQR